MFICNTNSNQFAVTIFGTNGHTMLHLNMYFSSQGLVFVHHMRSSTHLHSLPQNCGCSQFSPKNNFHPLLFTSCFQTLLSSCLEGYVLLFTDQEMSSAQNMTGAHVQVFMVDMTSCYFPS